MEDFISRRDNIKKMDGNSHLPLNKRMLMAKSINQKLRIKLNEHSADIKLQREKINQLRKERTLLDKMYSNLEVFLRITSKDLD